MLEEYYMQRIKIRSSPQSREDVQLRERKWNTGYEDPRHANPNLENKPGTIEYCERGDGRWKPESRVHTTRQVRTNMKYRDK